jgi:hypothetical protein
MTSGQNVLTPVNDSYRAEVSVGDEVRRRRWSINGVIQKPSEYRLNRR